MIHGLRRDAERLEIGQVWAVGAFVPERLAGAWLVLSGACVDQDDSTGKAQQNRMDRQRERLAPHVSRLEPVTMFGQGLRVGARKQPAQRQLEPFDIDDPVEPGIPDGKRRKVVRRGQDCS